MSSEDVLKRFGRYFLLDRIAQGGMAEIYRARLAAPDGGGRLLIIKRIHSNYKSNAEFLDMFKSEIKLTMGFSNPNIVQLYDYGDSEGMPYIAMEYVDGKTVRQFAARFFKKKEMLPIDIVLHIVEQAARGLSYAHTYKDKMSDKELNIVHRDISPQNIIISYDGVIKVIDFGIAKAATSVDLTRTGIIKGKPSYMAPEQINGEELDGRADLFALGIVLWELLTGKKLFSTSGKSEYSVLKMIEKCEKTVKPPSLLNPAIPPELDAIVLKALRKSRGDRYGSAAEFQKALQKYLVTHHPDFNMSELPYWMDRLFAEDKAADQVKMRQLNYKAEELLRAEVAELSAANDVTSAIFDRGSGGMLVKAGSKSGPGDDASIRKLLISDGIRRREEGKGGLSDSPYKNQGRVIEFDQNPLQPPTERLKLDDSNHLRRSRPISKLSGRTANRARRLALLSGVAALLAVVAYPSILLHIPFVSDVVISSRAYYQALQEGKTYFPVLSELVKPAKGNLVEEILTKTEEPFKNKKWSHAYLTLRVTPAGGGTRIMINGTSVTGTVPVLEVPVDSKVAIEVERPKFKSFKKEFTISTADLKASPEYQYEVVLEPETFGYLSVKGDLSAEIHVRELDPGTGTMGPNSATWYFRSRFEQQKFPPGLYSVQLTNRALDMEAVETVKVDKGLINRVTLELEETVSSNMIQVAPDKILGLVAWFRANTITGARLNDPVAVWNDSSRNLFQSVQPDPVRRPTFISNAVNAQAVLHFDGGRQYFDSDSLAGSLRGLKTTTVIYVAREESGSRQGLLGCYRGNRSEPVFEIAFANRGRVQLHDNDRDYEAQGRAVASTSEGPGRFGIYSAVFTSSSVMLFENGQRTINAPSGGMDFSSAAHCVLGQNFRRGAPADFFKGDLAEVIVYDHALSAREQANIELYLGRIYGIDQEKK